MEKKRLCTILRILMLIEIIIILGGTFGFVYYLGPSDYSMLLAAVTPVVLLLFFFTLLFWLWFCKFMPSMNSET